MKDRSRNVHTGALIVEERANPAAIGWRAVIDGTEIEIAWPRGTRTLLMGMRTVGETAWRFTGATLDRDRWAIDGTRKSAQAVARRFLEEAAS